MASTERKPLDDCYFKTTDYGNITSPTLLPDSLINNNLLEKAEDLELSDSEDTIISSRVLPTVTSKIVPLRELSMDEFIKYKQYNQRMTPEVEEYYKKNKHKFQQPHGKHSYRNKKPVIHGNNVDKVTQSLTAILNKLSNDNYIKLTQDIKALGINRVEDMNKLVDSVFLKAVNEYRFNESYAKLATELGAYHICVNNQNVYFKNLMIFKCQTMFNQIIILSKNYESKNQALGCFRFISNLFNTGFMSGKILQSCLQLVLDKIKKGDHYLIEYISLLLKISGKRYYETHRGDLNRSVAEINKIVQKGGLSNKDKFTLMDIVEIHRDHKWA